MLIRPYLINGAKYISIGSRVEILEGARIEALKFSDLDDNEPVISIGNRVSINPRVHIACVNSIRILDNVLIASNVFITDHGHGLPDFSDIETPPSLRKVVSKGGVEINENVWLGENVVVLPGVSIGRNSVIGANSVVSKSIPPYCVAAGCPAKIIRKLK